MKKETKEAFHAYVLAVNKMAAELVAREYMFTPKFLGELTGAGHKLLAQVDSEPETIQTVPAPEPPKA